MYESPALMRATRGASGSTQSDGVAGLRERDGEGEADVAGSDDGDACIHDDCSLAGAPRGSRHQASHRAGRVAVAVDLGVRSRRAAASAAAAAIAAGSSPTSTFQPSCTVSTHSVVSRSVTHGTQCR